MGTLRVKELRDEKGLTQAQLAASIGVDQRTISNYENGVSEPNVQIIKKLCDFFNVTSDYLLGFKDF